MFYEKANFLLITFFIKGLECKSESSFIEKINSESLDTYWYRIDLDKGRVLYNSTSQNYLIKLRDLIGDKLRGDVSNLYWTKSILGLCQLTLEIKLERLLN